MLKKLKYLYMLSIYLSLFPILLFGIDPINQTEMLTVNKVNLDQYIGLWFEISKLPNPFQKMCTGNTTAQYTLREDGRIDVLNRCMKNDGSYTQAKGIAKIVDKKTNAKLKVSFVRFLGISLFWGDYWIIGLDENYQYAIVGEPSRKYGWILCRTPELSKGQWESIHQILIEQGYNPEIFVKTGQNRTDFP